MGISILSCSSITGDKPSEIDPIPTRFVINSVRKFRGYLLVDVTYPNCQNYEGRKLMVYQGIIEEQLKERIQHEKI
jgi:hypothetical protein